MNIPSDFGYVSYNDWPLVTNNKGKIFWGEDGHDFMEKLNKHPGVKSNQLYFNTIQSAQNMLEKYYRMYLKSMKKKNE